MTKNDVKAKHESIINNLFEELKKEVEIKQETISSLADCDLTVWMSFLGEQFGEIHYEMIEYLLNKKRGNQRESNESFITLRIEFLKLAAIAFAAANEIEKKLL